MRFLVYLTAGLAGGVLGGMGMGGGTVLIPILTMFCGVPQHLAQSVNLLSFLPMAAVSLRVHARNGLLDTKNVLWMVVPATEYRRARCASASAHFCASCPSINFIRVVRPRCGSGKEDNDNSAFYGGFTAPDFFTGAGKYGKIIR